MITSLLKGRMGNQMFQIAAAIGFATKHKHPWIVPPHTEDEKKWPHYFEGMANILSNDFKEFVRRAPVQKEEGFHYTEIPFYSHDMVLDGYFQSEKYFEHCKDNIRERFTDQIYSIVTAHSAISIHVRRGDYLNLSAHHPVLDVDYYRRAIWKFIEKGYESFLIFSDDIKWCKDEFVQQLPGRGKYIFADQVMDNEVAQAKYEMFQMMLCTDGHIIANSSFSWWGAWLNPNEKKIVIAPKTWFGSALQHLDTKDLLPDSWIKL